MAYGGSAVQDPWELTRRFYDGISSAYDLLADRSEREARAAGLGLLECRAGEQVLEVGFGTGSSLVELARAVAPQSTGAEQRSGGHVVGVDLSSGMHRMAARRLRAADIDTAPAHEEMGEVAAPSPEATVTLLQTAVPPLPLAEDSFDAAFLSFTLELFEEEPMQQLLAELRRVLRPTGRLAVVSMATSSAGQSDSLVEKTYKWMHQHFPHIVDCQPIDAAKFVGEEGFEVVRRADLAIWTMPVVALVGRRD